MAKRVKFNDEVIEHIIENNKNDESLDVDENEDNLIQRLGKRVLKIDDIEGQEDDTLAGYDDIRITPFNLKEESEEGHFDQNGNFIFDKVDKANNDPWLDSIEWENVTNTETEVIEGKEKEIDRDSTIKKIVDVIKSNETVTSALKRLNVERKTNKSDKFKTTIYNLTEWADDLLLNGMTDIYSLNGNSLLKLILNDEDNDDTKIWFYKWASSGDEYGPFSYQQLIDWHKAGYFKSEMLFRKRDEDEYINLEDVTSSFLNS